MLLKIGHRKKNHRAVIECITSSTEILQKKYRVEIRVREREGHSHTMRTHIDYSAKIEVIYYCLDLVIFFALIKRAHGGKYEGIKRNEEMGKGEKITRNLIIDGRIVVWQRILMAISSRFEKNNHCFHFKVY